MTEGGREREMGCHNSCMRLCWLPMCVCVCVFKEKVSD